MQRHRATAAAAAAVPPPRPAANWRSRQRGCRASRNTCSTCLLDRPRRSRRALGFQARPHRQRWRPAIQRSEVCVDDRRVSNFPMEALARRLYLCTARVSAVPDTVPKHVRRHYFSALLTCSSYHGLRAKFHGRTAPSTRCEDLEPDKPLPSRPGAPPAGGRAASCCIRFEIAP